MSEANRIYQRFPGSVVAFRAAILLTLNGVLAAAVFSVSLWGGVVYLFVVMLAIGVLFTQGCARCDYMDSTCDTGLSVIARRFVRPNSDRQGFAKAALRCLWPIGVVCLASTAVSIAQIVSHRSLFHIGALCATAMLIALFLRTSKTMTCPHCRMNDVCPLGRDFRADR